MRLKVLLFAGARDAAGENSVDVDVSDQATVGELMSNLGDQYPALAEFVPFCRLAVDNRFSEASTNLTGTQELALIPPVSGG